MGEHWYAWRGGPSILHAVADDLDRLEQAVSELMPQAIVAYKAAVKPPPAVHMLDGLITEFLAPAADAKTDVPAHLSHLAATTISHLRDDLDIVRADLGELPLIALAAKDARKSLLAWRDGYAATPCTADDRLAALGRVLKWAKDLDKIAVNPLEAPWPRIYKPTSHAEAIWKKADLILLLKGAAPEFRDAVLFSIFTGLRISDAIRVTWAQVGKKAIVFNTGKSRGRRVITIPITPPLAALLRRIGRKDVGTVLTSSRGKPWNSGLQTAIQRRKTALGIKGLRWHDLRGTAATRFIRHGLPVEDVALIVGWDKQRVEALSYYVTGEAVAEGMLARLKALRATR